MNKLVRLAVSALLLTWVGYHTDWSAVGSAFANLGVSYWLLGMGLLVVTQLVSAARWLYFARHMRFDAPLSHLAGFYFIGMYFNLMLPTAVGGDVVRAWYLDSGRGRRLAALGAVLLDRLSGLFVLVAMACVASLLCPDLPPWILWSVWSVAGCGVLGVALLPLFARYSPFGRQRLGQLVTLLQTLAKPSLLVGPTLLSLFVQAANVIIVWLIGLALGVPVPFAFYWVLVPMVSLLTMLPISVNGMGVREGAVAVMLAPLGIAHGPALTLALLWFAVYAAVSLLGGVVYLFGRFPKPNSAAAPAALDENHGPLDRHPDQGREGQLERAA